ncbi:MAG: ankyrin repeat domain-containing protein [Shewanella sp.]|nr:ankyrin repeat domain-containing protein [Shewanella sp.]
MAISTPTSTLNVNATSFTPNPSKEPRYISVVKSAPSGLMYTAKPASVIYAEQPSLKVVAPNFHRFFNQLSLNHYPFVTNPSFIPCRVSGNQCFEDPSLLGMHPNQIASGARPYCEVLKPNYSPKQYGNHTECLVAGNRPIIPNQFLHPKKQEVENADHTGMTKMHQAAKNGNLWEVDYWCNLGANVNTSDSNGETAIQSAVRAGYLEVVQYLHRLCADLDSMDRHGMSVLHIAVESGHLPVVKFL